MLTNRHYYYSALPMITEPLHSGDQISKFGLIGTLALTHDAVLLKYILFYSLQDFMTMTGRSF